MQQKNISNQTRHKLDLAIERVQWATSLFVDKQNTDAQVFAIQTTRIVPTLGQGQLSSLGTLPYLSSPFGFNLGLHVGDNAEQVNINRQYLQKILPHNAKVQWFEQVHGNEVAKVSDVSKDTIIADAGITTTKNTCLAMMTADCLPILLRSKSGDEIAAIHGGWRPLAGNIIANTLHKMKTPTADIYAWLGPCISQTAFEVGQEVKDSFVEYNKCFNSAFTVKSKGKYMADLQHIARLQLTLAGVNHISALPECTYANNDKYFSYRKNPITGRMATLICIT